MLTQTIFSHTEAKLLRSLLPPPQFNAVICLQTGLTAKFAPIRVDEKKFKFAVQTIGGNFKLTVMEGETNFVCSSLPLALDTLFLHVPTDKRNDKLPFWAKKSETFLGISK